MNAQGLSIGQIAEWKNQWFRVAGRLRLADEEGFWDEWCLEFNDGGFGWLEIEDGATMITRRQRLNTPLPPRTQIQLGDTLMVNGESFFVVELCQARITGFEGQLPFPVQLGESKFFIDGNMSGQPAMLEYGEKEIEFGRGEIVQRGDITLNIW